MYAGYKETTSDLIFIPLLLCMKAIRKQHQTLFSFLFFCVCRLKLSCSLTSIRNLVFMSRIICILPFKAVILLSSRKTLHLVFQENTASHYTYIITSLPPHALQSSSVAIILITPLIILHQFYVAQCQNNQPVD